jgi:hypothetical protein
VVETAAISEHRSTESGLITLIGLDPVESAANPSTVRFAEITLIGLIRFDPAGLPSTAKSVKTTLIGFDPAGPTAEHPTRKSDEITLIQSDSVGFALEHPTHSAAARRRRPGVRHSQSAAQPIDFAKPSPFHPLPFSVPSVFSVVKNPPQITWIWSDSPGLAAKRLAERLTIPSVPSSKERKTEPDGTALPFPLPLSAFSAVQLRRRNSTHFGLICLDSLGFHPPPLSFSSTFQTPMRLREAQRPRVKSAFLMSCVPGSKPSAHLNENGLIWLDQVGFTRTRPNPFNALSPRDSPTKHQPPRALRTF